LLALVLGDGREWPLIEDVAVGGTVRDRIARRRHPHEHEDLVGRHDSTQRRATRPVTPSVCQKLRPQGTGVEGDCLWPAPAQFVVVGRKWKYAPPPWVMYEALVDDLERWLSVLTGELSPQVAASRRPDAVLLRPWVDSAVTAVELLIGPHGYGSAITVLAYGDVLLLPDEVRRWVRYRLGKIFGEALRIWVDEPHD
jgi:hypothetical protein